MGNLKLLYRHRTNYLLTQGIVMAITFPFLYFNNFNAPDVFLLIFSLFNIFIYIKLFFSELKYSPDFHPFLILPLIAVQFIGLNGLSLYYDLISGKPVEFVGNDISDMLVMGIWFLMLQHFLTFFGYYYFFKKKFPFHKEKISSELKKEPINYSKWALISYIVLWIFRIIGFIIPWAHISSYFVEFCSKGQLISLTLLIYISIKNNNTKLPSIYWIITIIESVYVLGRGSKEALIINLIPYLIFLIINYQNKIITFNKSLLIKFGFIGFFVLLFVFPYISVYRTLRNINDGRDISVSEALSEYGDMITGEGRYDNSNSDQLKDQSIGYALSRAGSIGCNGYFIYKTLKGDGTKKFFIYRLFGFIPRIIMPSKPLNLVGPMIYYYCLDDPNWETRPFIDQDNDKIHTSIAPGFPGITIMTFGFIPALFIFFFVGFLFCWFWFFIKEKLVYNVIAIWFLYVLIILIMKDFENLEDCGLAFVVNGLVYCILIKLFPNKKYKLNLK